MSLSTHSHSPSPPRAVLERFLRLLLRLTGRKENERRRRWRLMRDFYSGR